MRQNKFKFADHELAILVRSNMYNELVKFDANGNGLFEQNEIKQCLIGILNENENELKYVVNNVFRYDVDNDNAITYDEFVNFAVEQHFGEMAIQRLHKIQTYTRGRDRVMNVKEFEITLNECLKYINSQGTTSQYTQLFNEVDLDRDGWITYEHYFIFLREYFGSTSQALVELSRPATKAFIESEIDNPEERLARLIYSQLKVQVMNHDMSRNLSLNRSEVSSILDNLFRIPAKDKAQLVRLILDQSEESIAYERFMKIIVPFYFCEYDVQRQRIERAGQDNFVEYIKSACYFVKVIPSELILREVFRNAADGKQHLEKHEYINTLGNIFQNYQFDNRGRGI